MTPTRKKAIQKLLNQLAELRDALDSLKRDEADQLVSFPEDSERYMRADEAISSLRFAIESIDDAASYIKEAIL